jgi:hypothetical protein
MTYEDGGLGLWWDSDIKDVTSPISSFTTESGQLVMADAERTAVHYSDGRVLVSATEPSEVIQMEQSGGTE